MTDCRVILAQVTEIFSIFALDKLLNRLNMKRLFLTMGLTLAFTIGYAQNPNDYIVKTRGAKKTEVVPMSVANTSVAERTENEPTDFVGKNFKYYSLCDWKPGMKFMVLPEKYDLIVKTFCDASTGKEVSSMTLRYQIMVYEGHTVSSEGHARINFKCLGNDRMYYYEVLNGTFEDYCYNKMGVPTLAYLGDVDIAREKLVGKRLVTKSTIFYVDSDYESDGVKEVKVPMNQEVVVRRVGVGTRSFPVKIIVEDAKGNEFYQNVALSKTNCGMRDDEFVMDNTRHAFYGSFGVLDDIMAVKGTYDDYIGKTVHTKYVTGMISKGDGRERTVRVPKLTTFIIDQITPLRGNEVSLVLTENESRRQYFKDIIFNTEDYLIDSSESEENLFGYLFAMGEGAARQTSPAARAAIRAGRVIAGMSEDEVQLAVGEPDRIVADSEGRNDWIYLRSKGKLLIVHFDRTHLVTSYNTAMDSSSKSGKKTVRRSTKKAPARTTTRKTTNSRQEWDLLGSPVQPQVE